jgi:hypothetical protein
MLGALLTVAGCGHRSGASAGGFDTCRHEGTVVARADLDGDGAAEPVRLVSGGRGPCAASLVTQVGGAVVGVSVRGLGVVPRPARTVHLRGRVAPDLVLLSGRPQTRGGSQPHLFAAGGPHGLREVTADGRPVLPFETTGGGQQPMTATCTAGGGIAVVRGRAHVPPGIVLAWDVRRTTYAVRDGLATDPRTTTVAVAAADPTLRRQMPWLFAGTLFVACS